MAFVAVSAMPVIWADIIATTVIIYRRNRHNRPIKKARTAREKKAREARKAQKAQPAQTSGLPSQRLDL